MSPSGETATPPTTRNQAIPSSPDPLAKTQSEAINPPPNNSISAEEYKDLSTHFSTFVTISTFTCGLIVAFLSLSRDIIYQPSNPSAPTTLYFEIGMMLALSATGIHIGVIIIGGRAAALCTRRDIESQAQPFAELGKADFARYTRHCDRLQLAGVLILHTSVLFLAFSLFTYYVFPSILLVASGIGAYSIFRVGFWKISVTRENLMVWKSSTLKN